MGENKDLESRINEESKNKKGFLSKIDDINNKLSNWFVKRPYLFAGAFCFAAYNVAEYFHLPNSIQITATTGFLSYAFMNYGREIISLPDIKTKEDVEKLDTDSKKAYLNLTNKWQGFLLGALYFGGRMIFGGYKAKLNTLDEAIAVGSGLYLLKSLPYAKEYVKEKAKGVLKSPAIIGGITGLLTYLKTKNEIPDYSKYIMKGDVNLSYISFVYKIRYPIMAGYTAHYFLSMIKEYLSGKKIKLNRHFLTDNSRITGLIGGGITYYFSRKIGADNLFSLYFGFMGTFITHNTAYLLRNIRLIKKGTKGKKRNILERIWNWPLENPATISSVAFLYYLVEFNRQLLEINKGYSGKPIDEEALKRLDFLRAESVLYSVAYYSARIFIANVVLGSVLHTDSLRVMKNSLLTKVHSLTGNYNKAIERWKKVMEVHIFSHRRIENLIELGNLYLKAGRSKEATITYREAIKLNSENSKVLDTYDLFRNIFFLDKINLLNKTAEYKGFSDLESRINLAFIYAATNNKGKAIENWKKAAELSNNPAVNCLYASFLYETGERKKGDEELGKVIEKLKESGIEYEPLCESKRKINVVNDDFFDDEFVFKEFDIKKEAEEELSLTRHAYQNVKVKDNFLIPVPLNVLKQNGSYFYASKRDSGETLFEKIKKSQNVDESLDMIAEFLAVIIKDFSSLPLRKTDIYEKIKDKFTDTELNIGDKIRYKVINNIQPLIHNFDEGILAYDKDAHPENWNLHEEHMNEKKIIKVTALDFENKGLVPLEFNLVNLLEYAGKFSEPKKDKIIEKFEHFYEEYKKERIEISRLRYFNALIYKGLSLYHALSTRPTRQDIRINMVEKSIEGIERIKEEFTSYFSRYKTNYTNLHDSLKMLRARLEV